MAKKAPAPEVETGTEIATTFVPDLPAVYFYIVEPERFDHLFGRIQAEVESFVPDLTTATGRKEIASLAYKVTRTKTALDDAGKELNAAKRAEIDAVDAVRREIRAKLDDLAAKARKPLDEWEAAEKKRSAEASRLNSLMDSMASMAADFGTPSEEIRKYIADLEAEEFDADVFGSWLEILVATKAKTLDTLRSLLARAVKAEEDAAELARLRKAEEDREAEAAAKAEQEAQAAAQKAAEEQAARDAEEAEAQRLADIKAAEEKAAADAKAVAEAEAQAQIDAANAEAARLQKEADDKAAEEKRTADEAAARAKDRAHRSAVMKAAKEAIMSNSGLSEDKAKALVLAIVVGEIPAVTLTF